MKKIVFIIAFLSATFAFSQDEEKVVKSTLIDFKAAYNNSNYKAIFNLFNAKMKTEFPLNKVEKLYGRINKAKGPITTLNFDHVKDNLHHYKATFKRDVLDLVIEVDQDSLINTLFIKRPKRDYNKN